MLDHFSVFQLTSRDAFSHVRKGILNPAIQLIEALDNIWNQLHGESNAAPLIGPSVYILPIQHQICALFYFTVPFILMQHMLCPLEVVQLWNWFPRNTLCVENTFLLIRKPFHWISHPKKLKKFFESIQSIKCATISNYKFDKCFTYFSVFSLFRVHFYFEFCLLPTQFCVQSKKVYTF